MIASHWPLAQLKQCYWWLYVLFEENLILQQMWPRSSKGCLSDPPQSDVTQLVGLDSFLHRRTCDKNCQLLCNHLTICEVHVSHVVHDRNSIPYQYTSFVDFNSVATTSSCFAHTNVRVRKRNGQSNGTQWDSGFLSPFVKIIRSRLQYVWYLVAGSNTGRVDSYALHVSPMHPGACSVLE